MLGTITLTVGQTDAVSQKEDSPARMEMIQDETAPQVNGENEENKLADADEITTTEEEKAAEDKPTETNEVGFKKIFRFVGFKFTLKKDKNEKSEPVQLLTVKKEEDAEMGVSDDAKEESAAEEAAHAEGVKETEAETITVEPGDDTAETSVTEPDKTEAPDEEAEATEPADEKAEATEPATEAEAMLTPEKESEIVPSDSPVTQETPSAFKRFFTQGIFSNLRKKTSFKKTKDEEPSKDKTAEEDIKEAEENADAEAPAEGGEKTTEEGEKVIEEPKEDADIKEEEQPATPEKTNEEPTVDITATVTEEPKQDEIEAPSEPLSKDKTEKDEVSEIETTDSAKTTKEDAEDASERQPGQDKAPAEAAAESELVSSQEKAKVQGSPLKKLFTGAGLKKLSSKKQKGKKEAETKLTESGEAACEQIQSSTESAEGQRPDSSPSSPEESGEHVLGEVPSADASPEAEAEASTSDGERKKDGILPWASFKKLVTPKKRVKRPSESEDESAPVDKNKSATLSSTESAVSAEKTEEPKPSDEKPEEPKASEQKVEKLESSTEEPKKKMDTSVSWEALICVGSSKKRARKTSDSDDEETKIEETAQQSAEEKVKTGESALGSSQEADHENLASSPEPEGELVSTWESLKRLVTHRKKKPDDKTEDTSGAEQTTSDSEIPKEESTFSLKKLIPGRRKKKSEGKQEQVSSDVGSAEEDSDTPAVVPLSEYDNDQTQTTTEDSKTEETKPEAALSATPGKVSAEDRAPSWISATVEDVEEEGKQLSDIPEEGDTAATPKSTDNSIAEDIVELTSEAVTALEQPLVSVVEETEMVSAVSRITASPVTSGETTPVPRDGEIKETEVVLQEVVETVTVIKGTMSVTLTEDQKEVAAVSTEPHQIESATLEDKVVYVAHEKTEATSICTGLVTQEIESFEMETTVSSVQPIITVTETVATEVVVEDKTETTVFSMQPLTTVTETVATEVVVEDKAEKCENACVTEDRVHEAEVQITEVLMPLENAIEMHMEEIKEDPAASEIQEPTAVKIATINAVPVEAEVLEEPVMVENSPKVETVGPIEPTIEESLSTQTAEVTEVAVAEAEKVQELDSVDEMVAKAELTKVEEVFEAVTQEFATSLLAEPAKTTEAKEVPDAVNAHADDFTLVKETVCISAAEAAVETVAIETTDDHEIEGEVVNVVASETVEQPSSESVSEVSAIVQEVCEKVPDLPEGTQAEHVKEEEIIEEKSTVLVQTVIQNVVENLSVGTEQAESGMEPEENLASMAEQEVLLKSEPEPTKPKTKLDDNLVSEAPAVKVSGEEVLEQPAVPEATDKGEDITPDLTEIHPTTIIKAISVTETLPVCVLREIEAVDEEVAVLTVDGTQESQEETKVDFKQAEEEVKVSLEEEKVGSKDTVQTKEAEMEMDVQSKVQAEQVTEVQPEKQPTTEEPETTAVVAEPVICVFRLAEMSDQGNSQVLSETSVQTEEKSQVETTTDVEAEQPVDAADSLNQPEIVVELCQTVQQIEIEKAEEFTDSVENAEGAGDGVAQEITAETNMKDDGAAGQELTPDSLQAPLEEPQKEASTQETPSQEEATNAKENATCQNADAKDTAVEAKPKVEKTANAVAAEVVEEVIEEAVKEIEPVSNEIATVS
ncbi:A-kinase anchor protein 12b isoform X2 [Denticeps clupeoides]|uniref:A kinase-anchoring proteins AKAP-5 and AKAP-12 calmodulin (CaM)-binding domain-containing protein n=1 Tax=Denticeps clupeoides TaxID=299321 RepID=A0AAY4AY36_9TELE|nr:A-kinase anchor protein 12 isoform X2 [Denticeps clupeoides]